LRLAGASPSGLIRGASRYIKEQHDAGASNEEAVAVGIGHSGHVITAAAAAIAVVLLAFA
jgi:hypothetical protein